MKGASPAIRNSELAQEKQIKNIDVAEAKIKAPSLAKRGELEGYEDEDAVVNMAKVIDLEAERKKRATQEQAGPGVLKRAKQNTPVPKK